MSDSLAFLIGCGFGFIGWAILAFLLLAFFRGAYRHRDPDDLSDETGVEATREGFKAAHKDERKTSGTQKPRGKNG